MGIFKEKSFFFFVNDFSTIKSVNNIRQMALYQPITSADQLVPAGEKGYSYYGIEAAMEYF